MKNPKYLEDPFAQHDPFSNHDPFASNQGVDPFAGSVRNIWKIMLNRFL